MPEQIVPALATDNEARQAGSPTVIVHDVHVRYLVGTDSRRTMRQIIASPLRGARFREVHALKGVSFTAHAGEVIGVIGSNGSGKSTLMRVVAGLQPVASGSVEVRSTPMLLGVGAVLNRTLSGRRNILLGGLALGMSKADVLEREESIIEFSGIGEAIDLPMRTYSSGMSARLQFAISAAVEPEILIVDEALSVGDQTFRQKSNRRIRELRAAAGTVFLVSHSMSTLRETCTRVIWLEDGLIKGDGDPNTVIKEYRRPIRRKKRQQQRRRQRRKQEAELARLAAEGRQPEQESSTETTPSKIAPTEPPLPPAQPATVGPPPQESAT